MFSFNDVLQSADVSSTSMGYVDWPRSLSIGVLMMSDSDFKDLKNSLRVGLTTMRDGFQMVARIPYPFTVPKCFAVASEVATMAFLRSSGLPIPGVRILAWAGQRSRVYFSELESKMMMSITFPAGGSLYYAEDLEKMVGRPGIPLENEQFCFGPDTRVRLWYGRRSQLDVDRGPCMLSAFFHY
jgi:hypothetical protein